MPPGGSSEPIPAECGGRGACGRCLVRVVDGEVPEYRILHRRDGRPEVLACLTPIRGPLTVLPAGRCRTPPPDLARPERRRAPARRLGPVGAAARSARRPHRRPGLSAWPSTSARRRSASCSSGWPTVKSSARPAPTTRRSAVGADVVSRIVAAEKGLLDELASLVRDAAREMVTAAAAAAGVDPRRDPRLRGRGQPDHDAPAAGGGSLGHPPGPVRAAGARVRARSGRRRSAGPARLTPSCTRAGGRRLGRRRHRGGRRARRLLPRQPTA